MSSTPPLLPVLTKPTCRNEHRRFTRRAEKHALVEPLPGYFISTAAWDNLSIEDKILSKIYANAHAHPHWPLSFISAAAVLGAPICASLYTHTHFATDEHTSTSPRVHNPMQFHYIKNSRPHRAIAKAVEIYGKPSSSIEPPPAHTYRPINDEIGMFNGVCVTSPLRSIFDCMRILPFEYGLAIGDALARRFSISERSIMEYAKNHSSCRNSEATIFKLKFINPRSPNARQSISRACIIRAGYEVPAVNIDVRNPLHSPDRAGDETLENAPILHANFVWKIPSCDHDEFLYESPYMYDDLASSCETAPHIFKFAVAQLNDFPRYLNSFGTPQVSDEELGNIIARMINHDTILSLKGYLVQRFSFSDAVYNNSEELIESLDIIDIPYASDKEIALRNKFLGMVCDISDQIPQDG